MNVKNIFLDIGGWTTQRGAGVLRGSGLDQGDSAGDRSLQHLLSGQGRPDRHHHGRQADQLLQEQRGGAGQGGAADQRGGLADLWAAASSRGEDVRGHPGGISHQPLRGVDGGWQHLRAAGQTRGLH